MASSTSSVGIVGRCTAMLRINSATGPTFVDHIRYTGISYLGQFPKWSVFTVQITTYGLRRGGNAPWFMRWLRRYINCLFVCLLNFLSHFLPSLLFSFFVLSFFLTYLYTSLLVYFLTYLSTLSRIDMFRFQAECRRRRPNLALVVCVNFFIVVYFVMGACLLLLCLFSFFSRLY